MTGDPQKRWLFWLLVAVFGGGGVVAFWTIPQWDFPPIQSREWGPPAIAMDTFTNPDEVHPLNALDFPLPDPVEDRGIPASAVYDDLEVLGEVDAARFDRLMEAITAWVAPEAGCGFCHATDAAGEPDYDAEPPYTFEVARQMLAMVRQLNAQDEHVRPQGVTCFTCHRGQNVPEYTWYKAGDWPPPGERWFQRPPPWVRTATTIRDFFPREAFELFILENHRAGGIQARQVNVPMSDAPEPADMPLFTRAENVYLFMMQMSDGLGVNCTYCHNSRQFWDWNASTPNRVIGWYAIQQTRVINAGYIEALEAMFPPDRLGPVGDPAKANCMTCHISQTRPLGGVPMVEHFPALVGDPQTDAPVTPATMDDAPPVPASQ